MPFRIPDGGEPRAAGPTKVHHVHQAAKRSRKLGSGAPAMHSIAGLSISVTPDNTHDFTACLEHTVPEARFLKHDCCRCLLDEKTLICEKETKGKNPRCLSGLGGRLHRRPIRPHEPLVITIALSCPPRQTYVSCVDQRRFCHLWNDQSFPRSGGMTPTPGTAGSLRLGMMWLRPVTTSYRYSLARARLHHFPILMRNSGSGIDMPWITSVSDTERSVSKV